VTDTVRLSVRLSVCTDIFMYEISEMIEDGHQNFVAPEPPWRGYDFGFQG